jgi:biopolymer transport protein ExbD
MRAGSDDDAIVDINVTPLVDVSLVLLIIFLATSYLIVQQTIKVQLPKASKTVAAEARTVAIMVKADGEIWVDNKPLTPQALRVELTARHQANPKVKVLVDADREVIHGKVVEVMDAARQAGIEDLGFAVDRP